MNDVNRLRILQDVIDRRLTTRLAATRLEISDRHCRRLLERYREHGPLSLVNRRRGQPGNRQLMPGLAERALRIIRERYADSGPTLACEKLAEVHGLYLAKETVRGFFRLVRAYLLRLSFSRMVGYSSLSLFAGSGLDAVRGRRRVLWFHGDLVR